MPKNEEEPPRFEDESPLPLNVQSYRRVTNGSGVVFWGLRAEEAQVVTDVTMDSGVLTGIGEQAIFEPKNVADVSVLCVKTPIVEQLLQQNGWVEQPPVVIHNEEPEQVFSEPLSTR